jgi:hypothetical protein
LIIVIDLPERLRRRSPDAWMLASDEDESEVGENEDHVESNGKMISDG